MKASSLRDEDRMVIWVSIGILLIGVEETDLQICIFAREIFARIHWIFQLWEHFSVGFLSVLFCVAKSEEKENVVNDVCRVVMFDKYSFIRCSSSLFLPILTFGLVE